MIQQSWASFEPNPSTGGTLDTSIQTNESKPSIDRSQTLPSSHQKHHQASDSPDPWAITPDQKVYYLSQFLRLQPNPSGNLSGHLAKTFFELSKLPVNDLSKIWELSDVDCDGQLTLNEFSVAMHLVVLKRNKVLLPNELPETLRKIATSSALSTVVVQTQPVEQIIESPNCSQIDAELSSHQTSNLPISVGDDVEASSNQISLNAIPPVQLESNQVITENQFRPVSNLSDAISSADGITSFDVRLAPDAELYHPVPIRALRTEIFDRDQHLDEKLIESSELCSNANWKLNNPLDNRPPTPPPRARSKTSTKHKFNANFNQKSEMNNSSFSSNQTTLSDERNFAESQRLNQLLLSINSLQSECDNVVNANNQLTSELIMLQKRRISLEILLDRLKPLEA